MIKLEDFIPNSYRGEEEYIDLKATNSSIGKRSIVKFGQIITIDVFAVYNIRRNQK